MLIRTWPFVLLMVIAGQARAQRAPPADSSRSESPRGTIDSGAVAPFDSLAATSGVPWNPEHTMGPRKAWEQVVLLPARIVSLPFVGLGVVTRHSLLYLENRGRVPIAPQAPSSKVPPMVGFSMLGLGDRTGLGGAIALQSPQPKGIMPVLSARYAATTYLYNSTQLAAARGPITFQYNYDWLPQEQFYGVGNSSSHDSLSDYATQDEYLRGVIHLGWGRDSSLAPPRVVFGAWGGPRSQVMRNGRDANQMSYDERFPALGSATLDRRVEHFVYGGNLSTDWRSGHPHWSHGGRVVLGAERFDVPIGALALHTSEPGTQFTRYSVETEVGTSFMRDPRTFRLRVRLNDIDAGRNAGQMLPSEMSRLGGRDGLSGYGPGRFHDLDLLVARLMYVFPLARLAEAELHTELGAVYADVWHDVKPNTLKNSVGISLRGRSDGAPHGELGIDFSPDGVRFSYTFGAIQ